MTAYAAPLIQDADDGPGELNTTDDGKVLFWDGNRKRFAVGALRSTGGQIVGHFGGLNIQNASDGPGTLTVASHGMALIWNNTTGHFETGAVGGTPGGSTAQVQYNNAGSFAGDAGLTYDDANNALTVTGRVVTPLIVGGTGTTDDLILRTTSGVGASGADMIFQVGNNGATQGMIIDNSGNIGIGPSAPSSSVSLNRFLHISSALHAGIVFEDTAVSTKKFEMWTDGGVFNLHRQNTNQRMMAITDSGVIGFNVATPTGANVQINGTGGATPQLKIVGTAAGSYSSIDIYGGSGVAFASRFEFGQYDTTGAVPYGVFFLNTGNGPMEFATNNAYYMHISTAGLISIGHRTPTAVADIAASTTARASQRIRTGVAPTSPNDGDVWYDGTDYRFRVSTNSYSIGTVVRTTKIAPLTDSTTGMQLMDAAGTTTIGIVDTTNKRVAVGPVVPSTSFEVTGPGEFGATFPEVRVTAYTNGAGGGPLFSGRRSQGAAGAHGQTTVSQTAFTLGGYGNDGTAFREIGIVLIVCDETTTSAAAGGRIVFSTTAKGTLTRTERIRITSDGYVGVGAVTTPTALLDLAASTTTRASLRIRSGVAPTTPNEGDIWFDGTNIKVFVGGVTKTFTLV
jgi:hypothetical protein